MQPVSIGSNFSADVERSILQLSEIKTIKLEEIGSIIAGGASRKWAKG